MIVERARPMVRRGVTQLMYVGDDDAVEKACRKIGDVEVMVGLGAGVAAMYSKGWVRLVAAGIASVVGLRVLADMKRMGRVE